MKTCKFKIPTDTIKWIEQKPYINDTGIWVPVEPYVEEGTVSNYKLLISKELFIEAYNKWIKGAENE